MVGDLAAALDWATLRVLSWRLTNSLTTDFCIEAVEEAIRYYGKLEIFNTDQDSQFTCTEFVELIQSHGIRVGMDGKGRWVNNVFVERLEKREIRRRLLACLRHGFPGTRRLARLFQVLQ